MLLKAVVSGFMNLLYNIDINSCFLLFHVEQIVFYIL